MEKREGEKEKERWDVLKRQLALLILEIPNVDREPQRRLVNGTGFHTKGFISAVIVDIVFCRVFIGSRLFRAWQGHSE